MNSRILIIGKNSFIGRNYRAYSKFGTIDEFDIRNYSVDTIRFDRYDVVLHLAAIVHQSTEIAPEVYNRVNTDLPVEVARRAKEAGVGHFIFLSTSKVYGDYTPPGKAWNEESVCNPSGYYAISKRNAERKLQCIADDDFTVTVLRTPLVYGCGVKANMLSLIKLVEHLPVLPFRTATNRRSITFAGNLAAYIDRIIELRASGTFIAQDSVQPSVEQLTSIIADALGKRLWQFNPGAFFLFLLKRILPGYYLRLYASQLLDNASTLKQLQFLPPFSVEEAMKITVKHYIENKR